MDSGVEDLKSVFLMFVSLTLMLLRTLKYLWRSVSKSMRWKREEITAKARIQHVEHASFTPLVLSASGGMAKEATVFYKKTCFNAC